MKKDFESVKALAGVLKKEWIPLLERTVPKVMVHILPYFAVGEY